MNRFVQFTLPTELPVLVNLDRVASFSPYTYQGATGTLIAFSPVDNDALFVRETYDWIKREYFP